MDVASMNVGISVQILTTYCHDQRHCGATTLFDYHHYQWYNSSAVKELINQCV